MQRLTARALSIARPGPDRGRIASTVAVSPVSWGISEAAAWGPQLEPNRVLTEMATLGANGIEAGPPGFLPDRSETARAMLRRHGLRMMAGPAYAVLHPHYPRPPPPSHRYRYARLLPALGPTTLVLSRLWYR